MLALPSPTDPQTTDLTLGSRLAELMYKNGGGLHPSTWGVIDIGGPYGSQGLTQAEALELVFLGGFVQGFLVNAPRGSELELKRWVEQEWRAKSA